MRGHYVIFIFSTGAAALACASPDQLGDDAGPTSDAAPDHAAADGSTGEGGDAGGEAGSVGSFDGGPFACGVYPDPTINCDSNTQYCTITVEPCGCTKNDTVSVPSCNPLPQDCQPIPTCSCVGIAQNCNCTDDAGDVTVTCQM